METVAAVARLLLAVTFLISAVAKSVDRAGSRSAVAGFGVPRILAGALAVLLPVAELAIAGLLAGPPSASGPGALGAVVLLAAFTLGIVVNLVAGRRPECHCFGAMSQAPIGWGSVVRNLALIAPAVLLLAVPDADRGQDVWGWLEERPGPELVLGLWGLGTTIVLVALARLFLELTRSHGRLLTRVERLELASSTGTSTVAPDFTLPDLDATPTRLGDLLAPDRNALVVFGSADCRPCGVLADELPGLQAAHARWLRFSVVSTGTPEQVRSKFVDAARSGIAVLVDSAAVVATYAPEGTPAAVLIDPSGYVVIGPAYGVDGVHALVAAAIQGGEGVLTSALHEIEPRRLGPGDDLPDVTVLAPNGEDVALRAVARAGDVLLFWDSSCGFAQQIHADVTNWDAHGGGERLVVVTRDAPGTDVGFGRRIFYDSAFAAGSAVGAPGTPSAVAVEAGDRIGSDVAVGGPQVVALLSTVVDTTSARPVP